MLACGAKRRVIGVSQKLWRCMGWAAMALALAVVGGTATAQDQKQGQDQSNAVSDAALEAQPFSYDLLAERMRKRSEQPYEAAKTALPEPIAELTYDQHRAIRYRPERGLWASDTSNFELQAFHPGWLFKQPTRVYEVVDGEAIRYPFSAADFEYREPLDSTAFDGVELPGVAGFRLHYPLNRVDYRDELISFLGASYFRSLGRDTVYGLSARGLAINTGTSEGEEFPRFSEFYVERPGDDARSVTVWAALEGDSVTGAYQFIIRPGVNVEIDVTARLFFRKPVALLGIAPLTSMYLFGENDRLGFDDYRPEVHDSDGLAVQMANGERVWRPLRNPAGLAFSYLGANNPRGFGLMQRDREFKHYEDLESRYENRPSLWIEPIGHWGSGRITLVEIPSDLEINDNVVAFWVPDEKPKAGGQMTFSYRMHWGAQSVADDALAKVVFTRTGESGVAGVEKSREELARTRKFVAEFDGGTLSNLPTDAEVEARVNVINGEAKTVIVQPVIYTGRWRVFIDVEKENDKPTELSVQLAHGKHILTEKLLYQWSHEGTP